MQLRHRLSSIQGNRHVETAKRYTLGAAISAKDLHIIKDWLLEANRDLEIGDGGNPTLMDDLDEQKRLAEIINTTIDGHTGRRGIHGPFQGLPLASPDSQIRQVVAGRYIQAIEFAAMFGGTHMVIHSPFQGWINPFLFAGNPVEVERTIEFLRATLADVFPVAEHHGVLLVLENIMDFHAYALVQTMETINHPNLRMSLDVGHAELKVPLGGMTNDQFIRTAGKWLEHIHIQDNDALSDRHWAPGEGCINFHAIFEALREGEQNPRMILELKDKNRIQAGFQHLVDREFGI